MKNNLHTFHIPVMGTGHSVDTPIRVAPFGISSVISVVDDLLLEKIRKYYCEKFDLPYEKIPRNAQDGRARRIREYLSLVNTVVNIKMARIKALPFFEDNDKTKYFEMLPETSPLKTEYNQLIQMPKNSDQEAAGKALSKKMQPGSIDVNIMVKLDKRNYDKDGKPLPDEFSDAKAALRGFAESTLESSMVFSAGMNKSLFSYMSTFRDFYRDDSGKIKKKIILKVSDFRSSLIQGRFLAKKGLEIYEYRIESGLNCGGHAFATNGYLMPCLIQEFKEKREQLSSQFQDTIEKYYADKGWTYPENFKHRPHVTVQGGIGNHGEVLRLQNYFEMDATGWATPFLLVPEATPVDDTTRKLLADSGEKDLFLSKASPLGVSFNNVHHSGSEQWTLLQAAKGTPGSGCPRQFLVSNTEFTEKPICTASRQYQEKKLAQIQDSDLSASEKEKQYKEITQKACLCGHLGSGALISLGIADESTSPQCICPGPNVQWFDQNYTLREMVDHIYGRIPSLVPAHRPHMFAKELCMYVDYFEKQVKQYSGSPKEAKALEVFKNNLEQGIECCLKLAQKTPYPGENMESLQVIAERENKRLKAIFLTFKTWIKVKAMIEKGVSLPVDWTGQLREMMLLS